MKKLERPKTLAGLRKYHEVYDMFLKARKHDKVLKALKRHKKDPVFLQILNELEQSHREYEEFIRQQSKYGVTFKQFVKFQNQ